MAAFVTVAGVDTGTDETVPDVKACAEGGFHITAVMGIYIHGIIGAGLLGSSDQLADDFVIVRSAGIFGADGYLLFGALQTVTDTAHIHGNGLGNTGRQRSGAAVTDFFVNGDVQPGSPGRGDLLIRQIFGKAQQDADAEFVIQETAFQITGLLQ